MRNLSLLGCEKFREYWNFLEPYGIFPESRNSENLKKTLVLDVVQESLPPLCVSLPYPLRCNRLQKDLEHLQCVYLFSMQ